MLHDQSTDPPSDPAQDFRPEHPAPPIAPVKIGGPVRRVLPWALSAAAVVGLMLAMLFLVLPRLSQVPRRSPNSRPSGPAAVLPSPEAPALPPPVPAQPPASATAAGELPLAVTLYSASDGKRVPVGNPVLISAYAALPSAGSATIAISYTRNGGPHSLLTLAQGSLSTASWIPALPGHYDFTASALDSRKISAFSRHITIDADAAPVPVRTPSSRVVSTPLPPVKAATSEPSHRAKPVPQRIAARIVPATRPVPKRPSVLKHSGIPNLHPIPYHVAAAQFIVRPIAETLAGALRRRGFHAFVRVNTKPHHKPTYVVETGTFLRPADAKKQLYTLSRDGYPAFVSR